ncbi:hypothetical protein GCM10010172_72550 [Paractinoplanes ferrugineus]|uniref:Uncharacterized protein n=1 Tax=Paractinoplanes ferrugineus TaxID=113564 RepID=A0A919IZB2_9ACTN|nr:hypothetical protein [Actinoplanes ferrugineus]GIE11590.1 hypothetical protein Afe05nite_34300 [Actinoplanes ferrugineus]
MTDELPWENYDRDRLRSGRSYPVGRDFVERCLRETGAVVGSLSFVGGTADPQHTAERFGLLDLFWFSDVPGRIAFNRARSPASHLFMRVWAVPSGQRRQAAQLLADGLPTACR